MAHFDALKPGFVWGALSLLSSALMMEIDKRIYKSVNGDEGGVYAPTPDRLVFGGLGVDVTGPFTAFDAELQVPAGKYISVASGATAAFAVGSTTNLFGTTSMTGQFTVSGASGQIRISNLLGLRVMGAGSMVVDQSGVIQINPGGLLTVGGILEMENASVLLMLSGSTSITSPGAIFNMYGSFNVAGASGNRTIYVGIDGTGPGYIVVDAAGTAAGSNITLQNGATITATAGSVMVATGSSFIRADGAGSRIEVKNGAALTTDAGTFANFYGSASFNLGAGSSVTIASGGSFSVNSDMTRTAAQIVAGNGAYSTLRTVTLGNANANIYPEHHDLVFVPNGLTATRTYAIQDPADPDKCIGFWIRQRAPGSQNNDAIFTTSAGVLFTLQAGSGYYTSAYVVWDPENHYWMLMTWTPAPSLTTGNTINVP